MARSRRAATMTRLNTSRPSSSVPNQCRAFGGCNASAGSVANGGNGTRDGPSAATSSNASNRPNDASVTGFWEATCATCRQRPGCGRLMPTAAGFEGEGVIASCICGVAIQAGGRSPCPLDCRAEAGSQ